MKEKEKKIEEAIKTLDKKFLGDIDISDLNLFTQHGYDEESGINHTAFF